MEHDPRTTKQKIEPDNKKKKSLIGNRTLARINIGPLKRKSKTRIQYEGRSGDFSIPIALAWRGAFLLRAYYCPELA